MHCPSLSDLPQPAAGKTGWPWTAKTSALSATRRDGSPWPAICIVTPSYNQGQFIEETIRSVLLQGYPNLQYIVIDGGSTDETVVIIGKYKRWLNAWISEKDRGQTEAINKGVQRCRGDVFNWLNSDDVLLPNALANIAQAYRGNAVAAPILVGNEPASAKQRSNRRLSVLNLLRGSFFPQPGLWIPLAKFGQIGLSEELNYSFDWEFGLKYLSRFPRVDYVRAPVVFFRTHPSSKSVRDQELFRKEGLVILSRLSRSAASPAERSSCRKALHRVIWERHLTQWTRVPGQRSRTATRMLLLALRNPSWRVSRFWFGALRRVVLGRCISNSTADHVKNTIAPA